ncbi:hypothetical protein ESCO_000116 [Escovopsis weberi]|uniref:BTB domain-containing protein n=1 Tax=Escovopsis weberi TaxID=150374 RepID=A0A0M9VT69_ESCWE|nr:hypothetical protein ESCO_000116 [Escovopsis weberi]
MDPDQIRVHKDKSFDLSGPSIEVLVGHPPDDATTTFSVHESLIRGASRFFDKALRGEWLEARTRAVPCATDAATFEVFLHWLYRRALPVRIDSPGHEGNAEYLALARAWVLGDMVQADGFRDAAADAMIRKAASKAADGATWFPVGGVIRYVYDNTAQGAQVRRLLVDLYTHHGHGNWISEWAKGEDLPKEFLMDLVVGLLDKRTSPNRGFVSGLAGCEYHEHAPGECYRARKRAP